MRISQRLATLWRIGVPAGILYAWLYCAYGGTPSARPSQAMTTTSIGKVVSALLYAPLRQRIRIVSPTWALMETWVPEMPPFNSGGITRPVGMDAVPPLCAGTG